MKPTTKTLIDFVVTKNGLNEAFRSVIAQNAELARELIIDYIECNWGSVDEYSYSVVDERQIETTASNNVY